MPSETDDAEQARSEQVEAYCPPEPTFSPESVPEPDLNARSFINDSFTEQSDHCVMPLPVQLSFNEGSGSCETPQWINSSLTNFHDDLFVDVGSISVGPSQTLDSDQSSTSSSLNVSGSYMDCCCCVAGEGVECIINVQNVQTYMRARNVMKAVATKDT